MGTHRLRTLAAGAAFACFFATLPIYSPNIVALNAFSVPEVTTWFSQGVLAFTLLAAALTAATGWLGEKRRAAARARVAPSSESQPARDRERATDQPSHGSSATTSRHPHAHPGSSQAPAHAAAAALALPFAYFIGGAGYTALVAAGTDAASPVVNALGLACALLAGLSSVEMCMAWARAFSRETLASLLLTAGVGIACAALLNLAASALPGMLPFIAHVLLLAVGSFAPLALKQTGSSRDGHAEPDGSTAPASAVSQCGSPSKAAAQGLSPIASATSRPGDAASHPDSRRHPVTGAFLSVMGTPLLGIALSSFVIGIAPTTVLGGAVDTQVLGSILAGVVLAGAMALPLRGPSPTSTLVQRLVVPVAASLALATCAFPGVGQDAQVIASYTLFSLVGAVALAMGCGVSNAQEFPRELVFSTLVGTYCLTAIMGLAAGGWLENVSAYHFDVIVALAAVYGVFVVASSCLHATRPAAETADGELLLAEADGALEDADAGASGAKTAGSPSAAQAAPAVEALVGLLAERFSLTPRETEIVGILARGHGCSYVADTLLISKSTVYTHVRNIYRKLDVSNHDGLIAKIYEQA